MSRRWSRLIGRPSDSIDYGREAEGRGLEVLIAGAGGAAHLPGMLAAISLLPVLGVPVESKVLRGVDSLLSIVQMPRGVPVGTLAIGGSGAANAAILAAAILARKYPAIREALARFRQAQTDAVGESPYMTSPHLDRPATQGERRTVSPGVAGRDRQRPTGPDVHPGGAADGLSRRRAESPPTRRPPRKSAHWTVIGPPDHLPALRAFAERAEAVTVEFENVSAPALRWLARRRRVRPGWRTLWISQNRLREKRFLARHNIPHAPWQPVRERGRAR